MVAAAVAGVAARVGPWLGRAAATNPGLVARLTERLRRGGANVGTKPTDVASFARVSPMNAAMVLATIASLGLTVRGLLNDDEPQAQELESRLNTVAANASAMSEAEAGEAVKKIIAGGTVSETLNVNIAETKVDRRIGIAVLGWARSFYGSDQAALRAHRLHQAFFEMPMDDVIAGLADFDLSPAKVQSAIAELTRAGL